MDNIGWSIILFTVWFIKREGVMKRLLPMLVVK